jgi:hypothetical protein
MQITDRRSLSVLMTALYVAKWESDDESSHVREISGSPVFSRLYHDVVDAVIALDSDKPDVVRKWQMWRTIEQRPAQLERTRDRLKSIGLWSSWSREQKLLMVEHMLSPFVATVETLEALASL